LVRQAREAERNHDLDRAADLYARASELDPKNAPALAGRDRVRLLQSGAAGDDSDFPARQASLIEAQREEVRYRVNSHLEEARNAIRQERLQDAELALERARVAAETDPGVFTPAENETFHDAIENAAL